MDYAIYIASAFGAVALFLTLPRQGLSLAKVGALVGAAALGGLWLFLARTLPPALGIPGERIGLIYYYVFSALALGSAVRVITHTKPVYSALWFVMVVLSSASLFLLLGAEFMALAMIIIYGGAILVTYMFVIMLASQAEDESSPAGVAATEYDRVAREALPAVAAGFVLLAVLLSVMFGPMSTNTKAAGMTDRRIIGTYLTERTGAKIAERYSEKSGTGLNTVPQEVAGTKSLENVERVGFELFASHPLSLELAGVILLVSLIGAVVISRQRVGDEAQAAGIAPGQTNVEPRTEPGPSSPEVVGSVPGHV